VACYGRESKGVLSQNLSGLTVILNDMYWSNFSGMFWNNPESLETLGFKGVFCVCKQFLNDSGAMYIKVTFRTK
jgi:hypothetical protein